MIKRALLLLFCFLGIAIIGTAIGYFQPPKPVVLAFGFVIGFLPFVITPLMQIPRATNNQTHSPKYPFDETYENNLKQRVRRDFCRFRKLV